MSNQNFPRGPLSQIGVVPMTGTSCQRARGSSWRRRRPCSARLIATADRHLRRRPTGSRSALVCSSSSLAVGSDALTVEVRGIRVSGAFLAIVLAMALLGPAPAAAIGAVSALLDSAISRRPLDEAMLSNVAICDVLPGRRRRAGRRFDAAAGAHGADALPFAGMVIVVFMVTNFLNFLMVACSHKLTDGSVDRDDARTVYFTVLPIGVRRPAC